MRGPARVVAGATAGMLALWVAYGAGHWLYHRSQLLRAPLELSFDADGTGVWAIPGPPELCCEHSAQLVGEPARASGSAARFALRRDDPRVQLGRRAELRFGSVPMDSTFSYAFSTFVPKGWERGESSVTLAQWHSVHDALLGEIGRSPTLRLEVQGDAWWITVRWDASRVTRSLLHRSSSERRATLWSGELVPGCWTDWLFQVHWSAGADGFVRVWRDGLPIVEHRGPDAFRDWIGPYLKLGLYAPAWDKPEVDRDIAERVAYFDEVRVLPGAASPDAVRPPGAAEPACSMETR